MTRPDAQPSAGWPDPRALAVARLGPGRIESGLAHSGDRFVDDEDRVVIPSSLKEMESILREGRPLPAFEPAGARAQLFFDPAQLTCGILTCGGLCPGLNNVIRSVVLQLHYAYGVRRILGFRYGYAGLTTSSLHEPVDLTPDSVESAHEHGGTMLGSSRGPQDIGDMVENLAQRGVNILFVIGGDGGLRGASALAAEIERRGLEISIIGIPKTIDNDLAWTRRSFGLATAVEAASSVILAAHAEARGAWNGVGLVKLMGRHAGFIAAHATLACSDVNFCLVPEVPFDLNGPAGFLHALHERLQAKSHAVVVVAEGAGQELFPAGADAEKDASGNALLRDVGVFLRERIAAYCAERKTVVNIRYIDPSYTIRSLPANSFDSQLCLALGQHAVHAGMAGRTNMLVGTWNQSFTHVPIPLAVETRRQLDPRSPAWQSVLETTGQPRSLSARTR